MPLLVSFSLLYLLDKFQIYYFHSIFNIGNQYLR